MLKKILLINNGAMPYHSNYLIRKKLIKQDQHVSKKRRTISTVLLRNIISSQTYYLSCNSFSVKSSGSIMMVMQLLAFRTTFFT